MKRKLFLVIFIGIFLLGFILRFYQLGAVPGSLEWDEASIGYNAYSILQTGKDEYGQFLPTAFRAFGEYKQPVYIYLDAAAISIFGLTDFAVRFPSAFFGSLSILLVYFLTYELFRKYSFAQKISLLTMLFFALSPWSIQFSRTAFEANVALAFIIAGVWLFLRGLRTKQQWLFILSLVFLVLSTYTYISAKVLVPIIGISLFIYGASYFKKKRAFTTIVLVLFFVISLLWLFNPNSVSRSQGVIFTNQQDQILNTSIAQMEYDTTNNDTFGKLLHNRRIVYAETLIKNYLSHFNPIWLFFSGDEVKRHHAPDFGNLYLVSLPFILLGIYLLLSKTFKSSWLLFVWFLAAPIASALTFEAPHALRSLVFLPTWHIFEAAGVIYLLSFFKKKLLLRIVIIAIVCLYLFNSVLYLHQYFVHTNTDFQKDWQYGYKEAVLFSQEQRKENQRIVFANTFEQPYIFYLYHTKYNPAQYINDGGSQRMTQKCFAIESVYFGDCKDRLREGDVYVLQEDQSVPGGKELKRFTYTDGKPATKVVEYK